MDYSPYFNPELETLTRPEIEALQLERLQKTVAHCMNSEFYRKRFEAAGIKPEDIKTLEDIHKIPLTKILKISWSKLHLRILHLQEQFR